MTKIIITAEENETEAKVLISDTKVKAVNKFK